MDCPCIHLGAKVTRLDLYRSQLASFSYSDKRNGHGVRTVKGNKGTERLKLRDELMEATRMIN